MERYGPVVVTVSGRDAVMMSPLTNHHRWVPAAEAARMWGTLGEDKRWAEELESQRDSDRLSDPWERA